MFGARFALCSLLLALLLPSMVSAGLAPSLKPIPPKLHPEDVVRFTKSLYRELGGQWGNATVISDKYRERFEELNASTEGSLGQTLSALFEIRMLDLQASVRHARKMRKVIQTLSGNNADRADI